MERFVACLDEIRQFMNEKGQNYPQLIDACWLTSLMFSIDFTKHFNVLNKKPQGLGGTTDRMFCDIKTFERKLEVIERDPNSGQLQYFPNLKLRIENLATFADKPASCLEKCKKFLSIVSAAKENFGNRFPQFRELEKILQFLSF